MEVTVQNPCSKENKKVAVALNEPSGSEGILIFRPLAVSVVRLG